MKFPFSKKHALTLQHLYSVKILRAERRVAEQQSVVTVCEHAFHNIAAEVSSLQEDLTKNSDYRKISTVCTDAASLVKTLHHRERIEYNLERQSFYLQQACDDVNLEHQKLKSRKQALEKLRVKKKTANTMVRNQNARSEMVRQDAMEEDCVRLIHPGAK